MYEYCQTWDDWDRVDEEPPGVVEPEGKGWVCIGMCSPWRGHLLWLWVRRAPKATTRSDPEDG